LAAATRRSQGCTSSARPGGTLTILPVTWPLMPASTFSIRAFGWGSMLRMVTGSAGSALSSTMPKRAANLASGG
jgi:hypothetical protein